MLGFVKIESNKAQHPRCLAKVRYEKVERPTGSDEDQSSPHCGTSAGVKARHLILNGYESLFLAIETVVELDFCLKNVSAIHDDGEHRGKLVMFISTRLQLLPAWPSAPPSRTYKWH